MKTFQTIESSSGTATIDNGKCPWCGRSCLCNEPEEITWEVCEDWEYRERQQSFFYNYESLSWDGQKLREGKNRMIPQRRKTDEEIKQLALDITADKVFTSNHLVDNMELLPTVFMPLAVMNIENNKEFAEKVEKEEITMIYEYLSEAGPRSCNGYPMFLSFKTLNKTDAKALGEKLQELQAAIEAV